MKVVIQRVSNASVTVDSKIVSAIQHGLLVFIGIEDADTDEDGLWLAGKIARMRIFADEAGVMNKDVTEAGGEVIVVSQFTLHASTKKGNRPSYIKAARPEKAIPLYENFIQLLKNESKVNVLTGIFGADMKVELLNDGPVTIIIDSKNKD
ncbi:MAG TPA: D-aminoacyl-tRNA deacylase [Flavobacteriales bacterium]|nr:D-aminoacyl-tRNA deacylase [Flavobacteriales bacterium]